MAVRDDGSPRAEAAPFAPSSTIRHPSARIRVTPASTAGASESMQTQQADEFSQMFTTVFILYAVAAGILLIFSMQPAPTGKGLAPLWPYLSALLFIAILATILCYTIVCAPKIPKASTECFVWFHALTATVVFFVHFFTGLNYASDYRDTENTVPNLWLLGLRWWSLGSAMVTVACHPSTSAQEESEGGMA